MTNVNNMIITHRITTSKHANIVKKHMLCQHFEDVKNLKNMMSLRVWHTFKTQSIANACKFIVSKNFDTSNDNGVITAWEQQKLLSGMCDDYTNRFQKYLANKTYMTQNGFKIELYKRDKYDMHNNVVHKKNSVKSYEIVLKRNTFTTLLNYVKYIHITELDTYNIAYEYTPKIQLSTKHYKGNKKRKTEKKEEYAYSNIAKYKLNLQLQQLKGDVVKWKHFKNIHKLSYERLYKLKPIEYATGSYIKSAMFNKTSLKPTKHSYVYFDDTNTKFKWFYRFKTPTMAMDIPLSHNTKYLQDMSKYDLAQEHYISIDNRGNVSIGLVTSKPKPKFNDTLPRKVCGIDLNVRDNFCVISHNNTDIHKRFMKFDYNHKYIKMLLTQLSIIDKRHKTINGNTAKITLEEQQKLTTLVNQNVGMIKNLISTILHKLHKQNVTDIVMENLTLFDTNSSFVKNKKMCQKYTRLVRMLHLSKVKDWFKRNAENYGMRVHFIDATYTSQECSHCHTILKSNRKGDTYECPCCGYTTHSDYNASSTILTRFTEDVLLKKLCQLDSDDSMRYIPKHISHKHIKGIITNHYYPNS